MALPSTSAVPAEGPPNHPRPAVPPARFMVRFDGVEAAFSCRADQRVLEAMECTWFGPGGAKRPDLKVGCRRGGCGVCRVRVLAGDYDTATMSAAFVSAQERADGFALACCIYPRSDLLLQPARKPRPAANGGTEP